MPERDPAATFSGSVPEIYDQLLVPLIFEPYAADLAPRVAALRPPRVLELAAGTGVVTRTLARLLPSGAVLVATDLSRSMLERAAAVGTGQRVVEWRPADAQDLPFPDASFDAVVCQFGAMFFPDKVKAFAEARRVLREGGRFVFNVWDEIGENEFADEVTRALARRFPADPPAFLPRAPYGYHDRATVAEHLRAGGFGAAPERVTIVARSKAASPAVAAAAFCQGSPLRGEIEARAPGALAEVTDQVAAAIGERFGREGPIDAKIQAHVFTVAR